MFILVWLENNGETLVDYVNPPPTMSLMLCYWIRSEPLSDWHEITIDPNDCVSVLKDSINFPAGRLFKVLTTIPSDESGDDLLGVLSIFKLGRTLQPTLSISHYFNSRTPTDILHFIVGSWHL